MKSVLTIATAGVLAVTLAACAGSGGAQGGQNFVDGKTFTMVLGTDPGNLDPHFSTLSVTMQVNRFLYDPLLHVDENGELVAGLAGQWEASTTEATFTLRDGLSCADGRPLTATTVADNINFVGDVENAAAVVGLYVPPGAKATADDAARTVTVAAPSPDPFLARNIGSLPIVCERGLDNRDLLKQGGAGTGMFTVTEAVAGDHYTLDRREDYAWGPGGWKPDQRGLPDKVVLRVVPNETIAANLLASGEVNAGSVIGPDRLDRAPCGCRHGSGEGAEQQVVSVVGHALSLRALARFRWVRGERARQAASGQAGRAAATARAWRTRAHIG